MLIFKDFSFDSAHFLPKVPVNHKCRELHGHTYRLRIYIEGDPGTGTGWVIDFNVLKKKVNVVLEPVDHHCLNNVPGLENPTCELLAIWLWDRLKQILPALAKIELYETATCGVVYDGK